MTQEVLYTRHPKNKSIDYNIHPQHPVKADTPGRKLMDLLDGMEGHGIESPVLDAQQESGRH